MTAVEKQVLEKFKELLHWKVKLHALVLFGSRARGDADPESDMDVLVVVDELNRDVWDYVIESAWEAGFEQGIVVVPVVHSRDEWENGPERYSLLAQAIRAEGIAV